MRKWLALSLVLTIAACGAPEISDLENPATGTNTPAPTGTNTGTTPTPTATTSGTPAPTPTMPTLATYKALIRPFEIAQGCNGCHTGQNPVMNVNETNDAVNTQYSCNHVCADRVTTYTPPVAKIKSYFCNANNTPLANQHQNKSLNAQNCADISAWLQEGLNAPPVPCDMCAAL